MRESGSTATKVRIHHTPPLILAFLKENNSGDKIRVITDFTRYEKTGNEMHYNNHAGEDIIRHIRGLGLDAIPVLVFSSNVASTEFVQEYPPSGSTTWYKVLLDYINGLVGGKSTSWMKWNAIPAEEEPGKRGSQAEEALNAGVSAISVSVGVSQ